MLAWAADRIRCLWGFHDFRGTSIPYVLFCSRCNAFRKVSSF